MMSNVGRWYLDDFLHLFQYSKYIKRLQLHLIIQLENTELYSLPPSLFTTVVNL